MNEARELIAKAESARKQKGKALEKAEKRRIKADMAVLNKALNRCKPEMMNENNIARAAQRRCSSGSDRFSSVCALSEIHHHGDLAIASRVSISIR